MPVFTERDQSAQSRVIPGSIETVRARRPVEPLDPAVTGEPIQIWPPVNPGGNSIDLQPAAQVPETRVILTVEQIQQMKEMSLEQRSDFLSTNYPDIYGEGCVARVKQFISFKEHNPKSRKPYNRIFSDIFDFDLYHKIHPDWQRKSISAIQKDKEIEANGFVQAFRKWVKKRAKSEEERRRYIRTVFSVQTQLDLPNTTNILVNRDESGNLVWHMSQNTLEENEQLGIRNIQGLFLENFPDFDEIFPREDSGEIIEEKKDEAKTYILERIGTQRKFREMVKSINVEYFERSYIKAIRKSFGQWGLTFKIKDFDTVQNFWHGSEEEIIALCHLLFREQFPEIDELLEVNQEGEYIGTDTLKFFILSKIGTRKKFTKAFSVMLLKSTDGNQEKPFTYKMLVKKITAEWGIDLREEDFGSGQDNLTLPDELNTPIRDSRGRVKWSYKAYSPEQNEQLAIRTIQFLFLEKFPEFNEKFPRAEDGKVSEEKRRGAAEFILEKVGQHKGFAVVFGGTARKSRTIPAFRGSIITAIEKSFLPWGIMFQMRDFRVQDVWKGKNKEEVLALIRTIFLEKYPEFKNQFLLDGEKIQPNDLEKAKRFILEKIPSSKEFINTFGAGLKANPELGASYIDVIKEVFNFWGIQFTRGDFPIQYRAWEGKTVGEIESIAREIIQEKIPEIKELIPRKDDEEVKKRLKRIILFNLGQRNKFEAYFPSLLDKKRIAMFNGSLKDALQAICSEWGIQFDDSDFPSWKRRQKTTDLVVDSQEALSEEVAEDLLWGKS